MSDATYKNLMAAVTAVTPPLVAAFPLAGVYISAVACVLNAVLGILHSQPKTSSLHPPKESP